MTTTANILTKEALDRAHTLMFANNLLAKSSSERFSIVATNPALVKEWTEELRRLREQLHREIELLDQSIGDLRTAHHIVTCEGGAFKDQARGGALD